MPADVISTCTVTGYEKDVQGNAVEGAEIIAYIPAPFFHGNNRIESFKATTTTNSDGEWTLDLIETETIEKSMIISIKSGNGDGGMTLNEYSVVVPNIAATDFSDIIN